MIREVGYVLTRSKVETTEDWRGWIDKMPWLSFPRSVEVSIIPPFAGALTRFLVRRHGTDGKNRISVYFDGHDQLGYMQQPYWEAYPIKGDTQRWLVGEEDDMIKTICRELRRLVRPQQRQAGERK